LLSGLQDARSLAIRFFAAETGKTFERGIHVFDDAVSVRDHDSVSGVFNGS